MDALASQSIRRLCERLESFRSHGPIPALMAEYPAGTPDSETQPLNGFGGALPSWSLRQLTDAANLNRRTWLAAEPAVVAQFRVFCRDAGTVAISPLRAAGFHVGLGTNNPEHRWLWAVFELAERQLPQTFLRLDGGDVFRVGGGAALVGERLLSNASGRAGEDPFAALIASVGNTRYWKLADAVDASLAALDIANTLGGAESKPTAAEAESGEGKGRPKRKMRPEEHLLLLYMRDPKVATLESRSLPAVAEAAFGEYFSDRYYRDTELYGEWRHALEETVRRHGEGWMEGDVLEAGLEIYANKPGRSDKRPTLDRTHEAAIKVFVRDTMNATIRAKTRLENGGK